MRKVTQRKTPDWAGATPLFGGQSAQKFLSGSLPPVAAFRCACFFAKGETGSLLAVKFSSSGEVGFTPLLHTEINQMNRPEERNCARPRPPHRQGVAWGDPENLSDKMSDILNDHERRRLLSILKAPPKQPKTVTVQARVEESVKTQLELYTEFIDASPSYVITESLKLLFRKDDDFKHWADQHTNNHNNEKAKGDVLAKAV